MKQGLLFLLLLAVLNNGYAQAFEDKIEYNKEKHACLAIEFKFPPQAVENAIVEKLNKLGFKGREEKGLLNKDKGFRVYKNALITDITASRFDYVIYVDRKSRRADDEAVLYMIIMRDEVSVLSRLNTEELGNAKKFLVNLHPHIEEAHLELQILDQEDLLSKAEKKLRKLETDKEDMQKKIQKLQADIKDNESEQEKQKAEIENQMKSLEALKGKRKKSA
jgi:hypothetical protein